MNAADKARPKWYAYARAGTTLTKPGYRLFAAPCKSQESPHFNSDSEVIRSAHSFPFFAVSFPASRLSWKRSLEMGQTDSFRIVGGDDDDTDCLLARPDRWMDGWMDGSHFARKYSVTRLVVQKDL